MMAVATMYPLLVSLAFAASAAATDPSFSRVKDVSVTVTKVTYSPPMLVLGMRNGTILRCPHATPQACEVYHEGQSPVTATVVHGEYLFASLKSGTMLRCNWQSRHSCSVFYQAGTEMTGLAVAGGFIHLGLYNGTILQCNMNTPHSCRHFADIEPHRIISLVSSGSFVYAGSGNGKIYRCETSGNCLIICDGDMVGIKGDLRGLATIGNDIFGLTFYGIIQTCKKSCTGSTRIPIIWGLRGLIYGGMAVYNGDLYVVRQDVNELRIVDPGDMNDYAEKVFIKLNSTAVSISFAYGTHAMQEKYRIETTKCIWKGVLTCPPTVYYYDDLQHRSALEVSIKDGRLYDSQGVLVDTSNADESYSQRAAIFSMGPDGQILLSKEHRTGKLHTSSLFAGSPVSGAGLMAVENGKILNITSCSVHYMPDKELNGQVEMSLRNKGYTDDINFQPCSYHDMLCVNDNTSG